MMPFPMCVSVMHDGVGRGARLRVFCGLAELSNCTVFQLAI